MLGRDVVAAAQRAGYDPVAFDRAGLDITDEVAVDAAVARAQPHAIINCAAHTDVDGAEAEEERAHAVNARGAGNVARAATAAGARVVHVSTDYVFAGTASRPYVESDTVGPGSAYGRTKLAGEREVASAGHQHVIVRSSWLFGHGGPNFVATMLRLGGEREEVSVVTDQVGCPTWTGHLAEALVTLARTGAAGVHHVSGAGACSWNELATEAFALAGVNCRVLPTTTEAFPRPAPRPAYSVLRTERPDSPILPPWQDGLTAYLSGSPTASSSGLP